MRTKHDCLVFWLFLFIISFPAWVFTQENHSPPSLTDYEISVRTEGPIPTTVYADHPFVWNIIIRWYGEVELFSPEITSNPAFNSLTLSSTSVMIRTGRDQNRLYTEKIITYQLIAPSPGEYHIGSASIRMNEDAGTVLNAQGKSFTVLPPPFSLKKFFRNNSWIILSALGVIFLIGIVTVWLRYRNQISEKDVPEEDSSTIIEDTFTKARRFRMEGDGKQFVNTLEDAIVTAFKENNPDIEYVSLEHFEDYIPQNELSIFKRFLENREHIKYAPIQPSSEELDRLENDAKVLLKSIQENPNEGGQIRDGHTDIQS